MRAFEIYVVQESRAVSLGDAPGVRKRARDMLDVFVGGANVTARVGDGHGAAVLRDLAHGVAALCDRGCVSRSVLNAAAPTSRFWLSRTSMRPRCLVSNGSKISMVVHMRQIAPTRDS